MTSRTHVRNDDAFADNDENYGAEVQVNAVQDADIFHQPLTKGNSSQVNTDNSSYNEEEKKDGEQNEEEKKAGEEEKKLEPVSSESSSAKLKK